MPLSKLFSNFVHFWPNFQVFCPFLDFFSPILPIFWKFARIPLLSGIDPQEENVLKKHMSKHQIENGLDFFHYN